jgi:hypothetical protein
MATVAAAMVLKLQARVKPLSARGEDFQHFGERSLRA